MINFLEGFFLQSSFETVADTVDIESVFPLGLGYRLAGSKIERGHSRKFENRSTLHVLCHATSPPLLF